MPRRASKEVCLGLRGLDDWLLDVGIAYDFFPSNCTSRHMGRWVQSEAFGSGDQLASVSYI